VKDPNNPSPNGDTWFDDPKNLVIGEKGLQNIKSGKTITLKTKKTTCSQVALTKTN
jgi:hypothetical protein